MASIFHEVKPPSYTGLSLSLPDKLHAFRIHHFQADIFERGFPRSDCSSSTGSADPHRCTTSLATRYYSERPTIQNFHSHSIQSFAKCMKWFNEMSNSKLRTNFSTSRQIHKGPSLFMNTSLPTCAGSVIKVRFVKVCWALAVAFFDELDLDVSLSSCNAMSVVK